MSTLIWVAGPFFIWEETAPLASAEKRMYVIICLFLIWLLKVLLIDLGSPFSQQIKNQRVAQHIAMLRKRLQGALKFLAKTTINKHGQQIKLQQLPWFLLIGPTNAGKTSLLANANINFILQKQFQDQVTQNIENSDNVDWWITRDYSIVDVPGKYLCTFDQAVTDQPKPLTMPAVWQVLLKLIRKHRGKHAIRGLLLALPLPEILQQGDPKSYQHLLQNFSQRLAELQRHFSAAIPCYLIITKCDFLPGFDEFFAELGSEEITQTWGVATGANKNFSLLDVFNDRFHALIKKLNNQLIWRLHHERDPLVKPAIKDFPLHVERLKECIAEFISTFAPFSKTLQLNGVYLTSALQPNREQNDDVIEEANQTQRGVQLFKQAKQTTRAYFIRHLLQHSFVTHKIEYKNLAKKKQWQRGLAYVASLILIGCAAWFLVKDFQTGVTYTHSIQGYLADYQHDMRQSANVTDHLQKTTALLNKLEEETKHRHQQKFDLALLLNFYSNKSDQRVALVYQQILKEALLPEIKKYFENYLQTSNYKDTDYLYGVLKAYLMLGEKDQFQAEVVTKTLRQTLPPSIDHKFKQNLLQHASKALLIWSPMPTNKILAENIRRYLLTLPNLQLSYIILKNYADNNVASEINLGTQDKQHPIFTSNFVTNKIPTMFTAKSFAHIISQEVIAAAQETTSGNWILGNHTISQNSSIMPTLTEQLRITYVNNYIDVWESLLANIHLVEPKNLAEIDAIIVTLTSNDSPLLKLLTTLHDNTYFEPIVSSSPKLQNLGLLLDKRHETSNLLYQIIANLQSLHEYIAVVIQAENQRKAAFEVVSKRLQNNNVNDAIMQLRLLSERSPEPIKQWLDKIADKSWRYLMQDATNYIDTSWQNKVSDFYRTDIANRYPFTNKGKREVELQKFAEFFGNPGVIVNFYKHYLQSFIDTSEANWQWKTHDHLKPPFSDITLRKIQQALQIHQIFFPDDGNKPYVQFALKPYKFNKHVQSVVLNFNDKKMIDKKDNLHTTHLVPWPATQKASIELNMENDQSHSQEFFGNWGWFRLVTKSFETALSKKEMLLNLSENQYPVRYLLYTNGNFNPFLAMNLIHFNLPEKLIDNKT